MLTLEEIRKKKEETGLTNAQLAHISGVPLGTVQKVLGNVTRSPRMETIMALSAVFEKKSSITYEVPEDNGVFEEPKPAYMPARIQVAENIHDYPRQGTYTLDDYLALPDEQRVELIDGVFYDMSAPTVPHQLIGGLIFSQLMVYVKSHKGPCIPLIAPTDVQLDRDNRTIVQPDVMIVCDRSKVTRKRIFGAPEFVVEVLSPSTKNKDIFIKSSKYQQAGVRELWLIDPTQEQILVYIFGEETSMHMYTFEEKIPVSIYDGECEIDFKEIRDYISFISE